jgi:hypothetical protein
LQFNGTALSVGLAASAWSGFSAVQIGNGSSLWSSSSAGAQAAYYSNNLYYNGSNRIYINTGAATEYVQSSGIHYWYTAGSGSAGGTVSLVEIGRFDTAGNFLIGTTSTFSSSKFSISYAGATVNGSAINSNSTGASSAILFQNPNGTVGQIYTSASVTVYAASSDYRLKTVIASVSDAGQRIDALEPIEYDWNTGGRTRGFLAHKFAEVYPNSVIGEKDAIDKYGKPIYQGMQASSAEVMADLIAEIQSLRKRLKAANIA